MDAKAQAFFQGKRILVIGAGYVGGRVAEICLRNGASVGILTRNKSFCDRFSVIGGMALCCEITDTLWHDALLEPVDHALVCMGAGGGGLEGYFQSYVLGMKSISEWVARTQVGSLAYTSSTSVYPQGGGELVDEDALVDSPHETGPRAHLLQAEATFREAGKRAKVCTILRLGGIYGPGRHFYLDQLRRGVTHFAGAPGHHHNLIHREDVVGCILKMWMATSMEPFQLFNLVDDGRATRQELVEWLAKRIGIEGKQFAFDAASGRNRSDRIVLNTKIKKALGWTPTFPSFRDGYEAILANI